VQQESPLKTPGATASKRRKEKSSLSSQDASQNSLIGCIDVESDEYIPPAKQAKEIPKEVLVEIESSGEEAGGASCESDWDKESNGSGKRKRGNEEPVGSGAKAGASDSETGDEEVESQPNG